MKTPGLSSRRSFLAATSAAYCFATLRLGAADAPATLFAWEYPVPAQRIQRLLAAGLSAAETPRVRIQALVAGKDVVVSLAAACRRGETPVWWELAGWTNSETLRWNLREHLGRPVKDATIEFQDDGSAVQLAVSRRGKELLRAGGSKSGGAVQVPPTALTYLDADLNVDWGFGPLDDAGPFWQTFETALLGSQPQALSSCSIETVQPSLLDPVAELAPGGEITGWYAAASDGGKPLPPQPAAPSASPFAVARYDRPIPPGGFPTDKTWPEERTGWAWSDAEIAAYRGRKEFRASDVDLVDVRIMIDRDRFFELLPAEAIHPRLQPMLRVVGMRVNESEWTPEPYEEVWLLSYAFVGQSAGWYALAHHASAGADMINGRETWGYPTKTGAPEVFLSLADYGISVTRNGREALYTAGKVKGFTPGMSLAQFEIFGLRANRFPGTGRPAPGVFVQQTWFYQGKRMTADPQSFEFETTIPEDMTGLLDPWHELGPARVVGVSVMEKGSFQRTPGQIIAPCSDVRPYYLERCDGLLPGESERRTPTFRVNKPSVTRS